jgi:hypothetical protein
MAEYYSVLKSREFLIHAITWMNAENIKLSEISQSTKIHLFRHL